MSVKPETIIRTVITAIALLNSILVMYGKTPLPFTDEDLYAGLSAFVAVVTTIWSWWKNNSFTKAAIEADEYLSDIKEAEAKRNSNDTPQY